MKQSMKKRFLALALGLCMIGSSVAPVYANETVADKAAEVEAVISEVSAATLEAKSSGNLVGNASFENADLTAKTSENYTPGVWYSYDSPERVAEEAHTGDYSVKVTKTNMAVEQDLDGSQMEQGTVYTARVWAKAEDASQYVHFGVKNFGGQEQKVRIDSTEYKEYEISFTYSGTSNPRIYIWAESLYGGAVYADDFSVVSSEHIEDFAIANGEVLVQFAEDYEGEVSADLFELSLTTVDGTSKVDLRQTVADDKMLVMKYDAVKEVPVEQTVTAVLTYKPTGKVFQSTFTVAANGEKVIPAEIVSLTAENGKVVATLKDVPTVAPVKEDFTLQYKVDGGEYKSLSVKEFTYDKAAKTITFAVVTLGIKADPQEVTVKVTCDGKDTEAAYTLELGDVDVYYVDATEGDDSKDGLSPETAWKSIEKVNATTFQPGDQILFQCGETWTGELMPQGSGVEGCPIVIASYGEGDKPVFMPGPDRTLPYFNVATDVLYNVQINNGISFTNQEHWEVRDLEFYDPGYETTNPRYTYVYRRAINLIAEDVGDLYGFTFDNLTIHGYRGPNTNRGKSSGGLIVSILSDPYNVANRVPTAIHDITVTNCTMYDLGRSGFNFCSPWTTRVDVEDDDWGLFGYSGFGEWKPCENIYIANNVIHDIDGDGVLIDGCKDVLVEHNTVYRCAFNSDFAVGMFNWNSDNTVFQYNEVYDTCPADYEGAESDAQGIEIDALNRDTWVQYNYTHDNRGGVFMWCNTSDLRGFRGIYRYNISQNDGNRHGVIDWRPNHMDSQMYNNTVYISGDSSGAFLNTNGGNVAYGAKFYNNIFYNLNENLTTNSFLENQIDWKNNIFYGFDNVPSDDSNIVADPMFVAPGTGEYGRDTVEGYKLQEGSPAIDAGINIEDNGGQDYFGTLLTDGKTDIGAAEYVDPNAPTPTPTPDPTPTPTPDPTPTPEPQPEDYVNPFKDVARKDFYYNPVLWGSAHKVVAGLTNDTFGPNVTCTRAQIVTFIWRAMGKPSASVEECTFTDVDPDEFYYKAMMWGVENQIVNGYTTTRFAPDATCTRAEIVTFLWRTMGKPDAVNETNPFTDVKEAAFFYKAMLWAVEEGIAKGYTANIFAPDATITRGETVTFLYRAFAEEKEGSLIGTWRTSMSCAQMGMASGDELDAYIDYDSVHLVMTYKLYYDQTMSVVVNIDDFVKQLSQAYIVGLDAFYADYIKELGLEGQITVEEMWELDEMTKEDVQASFEVLKEVIPAYAEGNYKAEDGKFYMTDTLEEELDMTSYEVYEVTEDTLTFLAAYSEGEEVDAGLYPLVMNKVK